MGELGNLKQLAGHGDILMVTLDTLRYDAAQGLHQAGRTPHLSEWLGPEGWELRHSPGSFTFPAHQALFAGFVPTPPGEGPHPRSLAVPFPGSNTINDDTLLLAAPDIVHGLEALGYRTICIGGVGFFNPSTPLGAVLPGYFQEAHWSQETSVTDPASARNQVDLALRLLAGLPLEQRTFLFVNIAAIHQPNHFYLPGSGGLDSLESHCAALEAVDAELGRLFAVLRRRAPCYAFVLSDHGTLYGEDGHTGHRRAHPLVWNVPYREGLL